MLEVMAQWSLGGSLTEHTVRKEVKKYGDKAKFGHTFVIYSEKRDAEW